MTQAAPVRAKTAAPSAATTAVAAARTGQRSLTPLLSLVPFVFRYRGRIAAALAALVLAACATLAVPLAVRRMIDFGFASENAQFIDEYFAMMLAVAAVLAGASALRYYLVMTLGERVVADLRSAVFAHVVSLSPGFFDSQRVGEISSRLTADTTQIKSAAGASASIALRNLVLFVGAAIMMVVTSPRLSGLVLVAIPMIVLPLGRLRSDRDPARAGGAGYARGSVRLRGGSDRRRAHSAGLHRRGGRKFAVHARGGSVRLSRLVIPPRRGRG